MYFCLKLPSASSWGCELKNSELWRKLRRCPSASSWGCELKMLMKRNACAAGRSASSWGCELKNVPQAILTKVDIVSLFVRLWVEKWKPERICSRKNRQPLREAVSWKVIASAVKKNNLVSLFVRLWVEKTDATVICYVGIGQPLREAVSWKEIERKQLR